MSTYKCKVCGYIHKGEAPPKECPVCTEPASSFEKISASNIWFLICIITFNLELILGVNRKFYWYHKSTTYATIVLLILLALSLPHKLLEHENKPIKI